MSSAPIYGLLDQAARKINLAKFRARKCRCLVVTDVAARGIDIPYLDNVINFDFPAKPKLFNPYPYPYPYSYPYPYPHPYPDPHPYT